MGNFFIKTIKLWGALLCFAISIGLALLLKDFFSNGGGFIRVKGLIAPVVFAVFGVVLLIGFIKSSFKQQNRVAGIISLLLLCAFGFAIYYFTSSDVKYDKLYNQMVRGEIPEEKRLSEITTLLNTHDAKALSVAIKCLEHYASNGSAEANYKLGEIYFTDEYGLKDYPRAFTFLDKSRELFEISETQNEDALMEHDLAKVYEFLGDIYCSGLNGETDLERALNYYNLSLKYPLNLSASRIEEKIQQISSKDEEVESDNEHIN